MFICCVVVVFSAFRETDEYKEEVLMTSRSALHRPNLYEESNLL